MVLISAVLALLASLLATQAASVATGDAQPAPETQETCPYPYFLQTGFGASKCFYQLPVLATACPTAAGVDTTNAIFNDNGTALGFCAADVIFGPQPISPNGDTCPEPYLIGLPDGASNTCVYTPMAGDSACPSALGVDPSAAIFNGDGTSEGYCTAAIIPGTRPLPLTADSCPDQYLLVNLFGVRSCRYELPSDATSCPPAPELDDTNAVFFADGTAEGYCAAAVIAGLQPPNADVCPDPYIPATVGGERVCVLLQGGAGECPSATSLSFGAFTANRGTNGFCVGDPLGCPSPYILLESGDTFECVYQLPPNAGGCPSAPDSSSATAIFHSDGAAKGFCRAALISRAPECEGYAVTVRLDRGELPTDGNDVIQGTNGPDIIAAGAGDDIICGLGGDDAIWGQAGNDLIYGGAGNDKLRGSADNDLLHGGTGEDDLNGGTGDDQVFGADGDDTAVRGGTGDDLVDGGFGNDTLVAGNGGEDDVFGGLGNDKVTGGPRPDVVLGGDGDDNVKGNGGADSVAGGPGNDELRGGPQPDRLDGGDGSDFCSGGTTSPAAQERDEAENCETVVAVP